MYNHIEGIKMSASITADTKPTNKNLTFSIKQTRKSTGLKSIDQLIARYNIQLPTLFENAIDNAFQKTTMLCGQDERIDFMNLPYCIYRIVSDASEDERFTLHRFYLPHKKGVRFATYLIDENGDMVESVCYQRNIKYTSAFKVIRAEINAHTISQETLAA
jgi:hypothetical protein